MVLGDRLVMCQRHLENFGRPLKNLDQLAEGDSVAVIVNVRGEYVRFAEVADISSYTDDMGRECHEINPSLPGSGETPYHIMFDYSPDSKGGRLIKGRLENTRSFDITDEMVRKGQVYHLPIMPRIVEDVARRYAER
ncbi:MAG: hypothetical protein R6U32_04760 [Candidatus Woesearchaeota archaeon]